MAQASADPVAEAQQRKAVAEAQAQALEAEKRALDAQAALDATRKQQAAAASPTPQETALADAKAAKDLANARKEAAEARSAAEKARLGTMPDSGIAGTVSLGTNAGKMEAILLAHSALRAAAGDIARIVNDRKGAHTRIYVYPAGQVPDFKNVGNFSAQLKLVGDALKAATTDATRTLDAAEGRAVVEAVSPATVGLAVEAITKLLGFFRSDFSVLGTDITLEDLALVQAVSGKLVGAGGAVHVPALFDPPNATGTEQFVTKRIGAFVEQVKAARTAAASVSDLMGRRQKAIDDAAVTPDRKKALESEMALLRPQAEALRTAIAAFDALLGRLMAPDEPTAAMLRDSVVWEQLSHPASVLLVLKVQASAGSSYTVKNLWTSLGGMPFHIAGGTVVSYALLKGEDGRLLASDVIPMHGGFHRIDSPVFRR